LSSDEGGIPLRVYVALLAILATPVGTALAQTAPRIAVPGQVQPGRELPLPTVPQENDFDFSIQQPGRAPVPRAADELVFTLHGITVVGATVYSEDELRPSWADLLEHDVKLADIQNVADAIESRYHQAGYALTRVYVPPQRVGNGVFTITVVEGFVHAIDVEGGDPASHDLIKSYLQPVLADRPLRIGTMERALLLANDIPGLAASGLLRPSADQPGASDLVVTLTPTPYSGSIGADNRGSIFQGPWSMHGEASANGLIAANDQLYANVASTPDMLEKVTGQLRYLRPIGSDGLVASFSASGSHGEPGNSLHQFDLVTTSYALGPHLHYPLIRSRAESLYIDGGYTWQDAQVNTFRTIPLSHDRWQVADASVNYVESGFLAGTTALTFGISQGVPLFDYTHNNSPSLSRAGAHTDFTKFTGSIRRGQQIYDAFNVALTAQAQYALEPLVSGEQIAFGGDTIGRGYDPGVLQGDHGIGASIELRYDLRWDGQLVETAQPYTFFDAGQVYNVQGGVTGGSSLSSTGFGVRVGLEHDISADLEFAQTLSHLANNDNGRLGARILFNTAIRF
jgi:hemolysin activation/secretion protein